MNHRENQTLSHFPAGLDEALTRKFGKAAKFKSEYHFFSNKHVTNYKAEKLRKGTGIFDVRNYIDGFMAGNKELVNRLMECNNKPNK